MRNWQPISASEVESSSSDTEAASQNESQPERPCGDGKNTCFLLVGCETWKPLHFII